MKKYLVILTLLLCSTMTFAALDTTATLTVTIHGSGTSDHGDTSKLTSTPVVITYVQTPNVGYYIDSVLVNGTNKGRKWSIAITLSDSTNQTLDLYFGANPYGALGPYAADGIMRPATLAGHSDPKFAKIWSGNLIAYDSVRYILNMAYDLGGRPLVYGLQQDALSDTIDLQLVLEYSVDNVTFYGIDSLNITTPETVGQYIKNVDLTLVRFPYWRLRFGGATSLLAGNIANAGRFSIFVVTNLLERW